MEQSKDIFPNSFFNHKRVMFKNLRFKHKRNNIQESHEITEITLLKNYLEIILHLLESILRQKLFLVFKGETLDGLKDTFQNMDLDAFLVALKDSEQEFRRARGNLYRKRPIFILNRREE